MCLFKNPKNNLITLKRALGIIEECFCKISFLLLVMLQSIEIYFVYNISHEYILLLELLRYEISHMIWEQ